MKTIIILSIFILSRSLLNAQDIYSHQNFAVYSNLTLYPDSTFRQSNTGCESEWINKGRYHIVKDTLHLIGYTTHDSIFPAVTYHFTPDTFPSVRIKIVDEDQNSWKGFSIMTGDAANRHRYYDTDSSGCITFDDDIEQRFIILTFLYGALDFNNSNTHSYFWSSKNFGTYTVTIKEKQCFALDRGIITNPGLKLFFIMKDGCLYENNNPAFQYSKQQEP